VDDLQLGEYKTRAMADVLSSLGVAGEKVLVVIAEADPYVEGSARNIPGVGLVRAVGVNVYDVLRHQKMVITRSALDALQARLSTGRTPARAAEEETS